MKNAHSDAVDGELANLQAELTRYQSIAQRLNDVVWILDAETTFLFETPSGPRILGYEPGYLIGRKGIDFVHPADRETAEEAFRKIVDQRILLTPTEFRFRKASGEWAILEAVGENLIDQPGVQGVILHCREITEVKRHLEDSRR